MGRCCVRPADPVAAMVLRSQSLSSEGTFMHGSGSWLICMVSSATHQGHRRQAVASFRARRKHPFTDVQLATEFAIETIAKHPIQGHFAAVLVHQKTNAMVCSAHLRHELHTIASRPLCCISVPPLDHLITGCRSVPS